MLIFESKGAGVFLKARKFASWSIFQTVTLLTIFLKAILMKLTPSVVVCSTVRAKNLTTYLISLRDKFCSLSPSGDKNDWFRSP